MVPEIVNGNGFPLRLHETSYVETKKEIKDSFGLHSPSFMFVLINCVSPIPMCLRGPTARVRESTSLGWTRLPDRGSATDTLSPSTVPRESLR